MVESIAYSRREIVSSKTTTHTANDTSSRNGSITSFGVPNSQGNVDVQPVPIRFTQTSALVQMDPIAADQWLLRKGIQSGDIKV